MRTSWSLCSPTRAPKRSTCWPSARPSPGSPPTASGAGGVRQREFRRPAMACALAALAAAYALGSTPGRGLRAGTGDRALGRRACLLRQLACAALRDQIPAQLPDGPPGLGWVSEAPVQPEQPHLHQPVSPVAGSTLDLLDDPPGQIGG